MSSSLEKNFRQQVLGKIKDIEGVICYNFEEQSTGNYYSGDDNGFFVVLLEHKCKNIKISHKIKGDICGLRLKLYYANQPENAFCEENSLELGFFDNVQYNKVINFHDQGYDAFRFDFGFAPIHFSIDEFCLEEITTRELSRMKAEEKKKSFGQQ